MKKKIMILLLVSGMLTGCKAVTDENTVNKERENIKATDVETEETPTAETESEEAEAEKVDVKEREEDMKESPSEVKFGSIVTENKDFLYLCSPYRITKINKATGSSEIIWKSDKKTVQQKEYLYAAGCGLLIEDKLYFLEEWMDESTDNYGMTMKALSVIDTDGSGYKKLEEIYATDLFLQDGMLCLNVVKDDGYVKGYHVLKDGSLSMEEVYPESEEAELLPDELSSYIFHTFNATHLLMSNYEDNKRVYYLVDKQSFDRHPLMEFPWGVDIITMDDVYVYLHCEAEAEDNSKAYLFERISLETGETEILFEQEPFRGLGLTPSSYLADYELHNGYIYYVGMQDYKLYMMRRSLEDLETEEKLGEAFFDSRIGEVGRVAYEYAEFSENPATDEEEPCATVELEWLVVDERYPGAFTINSYMKEHMNGYITYEKEMAREVADIRREYEGYFPAYSISSNIYEVTYADDIYLSYCQAYYEYLGGVHGMPYRIGYTFDLQTGKLLTLSDVIGNSEEELKEIVGRYFAELIALAPENYWEDSVENVKEWTDMSTDYYLTEEGIRFYQTPYAISSYAAGFPEVTIPYSEFEMKISLNEIVK